MGEIHVGTNNGGILGGQNNVVNNCNSFNSDSKDEITSLINEIRTAVNDADISSEKKDEANEYIETIEEISSQKQPRKSIIKLACAGLKKIAGDGGFLGIVDKLLSIVEKIIS